MRRMKRLTVATVFAGSAISPALGQCDPAWFHGPEHGSPGVEGTINAFIRWDPDGPGPLPEWLVVAGDFDLAGEVLTENIAAWDGLRWHDLEGGVAGPVSSLAVMDGQLYAGGSFWSAGGVPARYIARFDGREWHGLRPGEQDLSNPVNALAVHDGRLIAAGGFTSAGPVELRRVGAWDGTTWAALGGGFGQSVRDLAVYHGDLVAGGAFPDKVARWNGAAWVSTAWSSGDSATDVLALEVYEDRLIAGGRRLDGDGLTAENHLRAWDGSVWTPLGPGFIGTSVCCPSAPAAIEDLCVHDGRLVAIGWFRSVGVLAVDQAAIWDGTSWSPAAGAVSGTGTARLFVAESYLGELVLGGAFSLLGEICAGSMAVGDPGSRMWRAPSPGLTGPVTTFLPEGSAVAVGGEFSTGGPGEPAHRVGLWDGHSWMALPGITGEVRALARFDGLLIAGGDFTSDHGASDLARWDGAGWKPLASGLAGGTNTRVDALLVHAGSLYAAGLFTSAGGLAAKNIARWDGLAWFPLGPGLSHEVFALTTYEDRLIAGGKFTSSGAAPLFHVAAWDGAAWAGLARGIDDIPPVSSTSAVYTLAEFNGELIAAGRFSSAGAVLAWNVARWDGDRWATLAGGVGAQNDTVYALAVHGGDLYAGGAFPLIAGQPVIHIARWDGAAWRPLGDGIATVALHDPVVKAIAGFRSDLLIGGDFLAAGNGPAAFWARWGCSRCAADLNGDGLVDFTDYLEFLNLYDAGDLRVDFNQDGLVDFADYLEFLNLYEAGC